jgi:hypothetical protein
MGVRQGVFLMKITIAAAAAAALLSAAGAASAAAPLYGFQLGTTSEPLTAAEAASFLGAPDDDYTGLGAGFITYDFGAFRLVDGVGQDFNVYEYNAGAVEFNVVDILVSADNITFFNVEASAAAAIDLVGDEVHTNASFRRSYDLGAAVTALGVSQFRYLRLDGTGSGAITTSNGFDPDSVAAINYIDTTPPTGAVPEPGTWAMMILGFGAAGSALRRRRAFA